MTVIYIKHNNLSAGTRTFKPGTKGAELAPELKIVSDHIFVKTKANALTSEEFSEFIQAKEQGTYYLDFSKVSEDSEVYKYIHEPIYTGSLGEGYSILNTILQDAVRIYCEPEYLYDAMIMMYQCTPLNILNIEN